MAVFADILEQVRSAAGAAHAAGDDDEFAYRVGQLIPPSLELLADLIAGDSGRRRELRPAVAFPLAVAAGVGDLTTLLADPTRLLLKHLPRADVRDGATGARLYYLGRDRYELTQPSPYGYFTVEGQTLRARLAGEDPDASDFTAEIFGNFVPTLDEVPASCAPDLVRVVAAAVAPPRAEKKKGGGA